jgi:hypothetical protein
VAQGVKNLLGMEAPAGVAYIGDDRGNDVKYAMGDFNDRQVRSSYYLGLMFDPVQAELFQRDKNISQGGSITGNLTWISKNSKNKIGTHNKEWDSEQSIYSDSLSTNFEFREDSILGYTQGILDTLPNNGGSSRSHVANVIDQTSRFFKEGDIMMSRGSAVKYVKNDSGEESGIEFCRVWTKDRSYMNYSDTMKRTGNIRKYGDSVMSTPWNLNIGPMSNGKKSFDQSTNIFPSEKGKDSYNGEGFFAKKYMFSIENLAWKTSKLQGFTVQDLPYCERGPNGGRVMWFPPYDLKVSEQNSAKWEENNFLGRPEPIYTYQNTSRSGQISFKVVVDHPSVLNLLVREHFEGMSDEDSDNYINAFFAGCEEIDFYDLIRKYTTITSDDAKLIKEYLEGGTDAKTIKKFRVETDAIPTNKPDIQPEKNEGVKLTTSLLFENDRPSGAGQYTSAINYNGLYKQSIGQDGNAHNIKALKELEETLNTLLPLAFSGTTESANNARKDIKTLTGVPNGRIDPSLHADTITKQKDLLQKQIDKGVANYTEYKSKIATLKEDITKGNVQEITITALSSCSAVADDTYNYKLSIRRSHSIFKDIVNGISGSESMATWINEPKGSPTTATKLERTISFKDLGFADKEGVLIFKATNAGEKVKNENDNSCSDAEFKTKSLKVNSAIAFGCRQSKVEFNYTKAVKKQEDQKPKEDIIPPRTRLVPDGEEKPPSGRKKPQIDMMKRIIMKTLSECYYFKTLEEKDPVVFGSLKEKLKYFHPGFHSMTPEGLNARLTFIQQCLRPGDTIPIKGISDSLDLNARNTTFGPPPICVLRVGDFYHSKIIIRDVSITFEDSTWDLNPEGIGVQPMLANVSLQVNFIGGQGLAKPVERLQNALSSNFYANTEMYDERSISTVDTISGQTKQEFTKWFLEGLQVADTPAVDSSNSDDGNKLTQGKYIGDGTPPTLTYDKVVNNVFDKTKVYFETYDTSYNKLNSEFGPLIMKLIFGKDYRPIKDYEIFTSTSLTPGTTLELIGKFKDGKPYSNIVALFKKRLVDFIITEDICSVIGFDKVLTAPKLIKANELLRPYVKKLIEDKIGSLTEQSLVKDFDTKRNDLIKVLDEANFLIKYGYDASMDKDKANKAILSGYTSNLIYDEYKTCVEYIQDNTSKFYEKMDNTIDFNNPVITSNILGSLLSTFLNDTDNKTNLMKVFDADKTIFDDNLIEKLKKKLTSFIEKVDTVKFKFKTMKTRKNSNPITYAVSLTEEITDTAVIDQVKNLNSTKVPTISGKLNYYRNGA